MPAEDRIPGRPEEVIMATAKGKIAQLLEQQPDDGENSGHAPMVTDGAGQGGANRE